MQMLILQRRFSELSSDKPDRKWINMATIATDYAGRIISTGLVELKDPNIDFRIINERGEEIWSHSAWEEKCVFSEPPESLLIQN